MRADRQTTSTTNPEGHETRESQDLVPFDTAVAPDLPADTAMALPDEANGDFGAGLLVLDEFSEAPPQEAGGSIAAWLERLHLPWQLWPDPGPAAPLEIVDIDAVRVDAIAVDAQSGLPLGRPTIVVAVDRATRAVIGSDVAPGEPTPASLLGCFRVPSTSDDPGPDSLDGSTSWDSYALPSTIVVDNSDWARQAGRGFHALGIHVEYAASASHRESGSLERFLGRLARSLLDGRASAGLCRYLSAADFDPVRDAVLHLEALRRHVRSWTDTYMRSVNPAIGDTPERAWAQAAERCPPRKITPRELVEVPTVLGLPAERVISRHGLEFRGLRYNSTELQQLARGGLRAKVEFLVDPEDLRAVYVRDKRRFLPVPCTRLDLFRGLSLSTWDLLRRAVLQHRRRVDVARVAEQTSQLAALHEAADRLHRSPSTPVRRPGHPKLGRPKTARSFGPEGPHTSPHESIDEEN